MRPIRRVLTAQSALLLVLCVTLLQLTPAEAQQADVPVISLSDVYAEFTLGVFKMETGRVLEASDHLEFAWRMSGHEVEIGLQLSQAYYLLKNFVRCEMVLDEVLETDPLNPEALLTKAKVRYIRHDSRGAVKNLELLSDNQPPSFETQRLLGNLYFELGEEERAIAAYERCINIDGNYPYILLRYGRLLDHAGRYEDAENAFRRAVHLDPAFSEPAVELAELLRASGREDDALDVLANLLAHNGGNEQILMTVAEGYFQTGEHEKGIELLETRREQTSLSREAEIMRGRMYYGAGRYDEALAVFRTMLDDDPKNPEITRILGEVALGAGEVAEAREYFERGIAIAPNDYRGYLALFFASSTQFSDASKLIELTPAEQENLLSKASRNVPGHDFDGNYMMGISFLSVDSLSAARRHLLRANEIRAGDRGTLLNLATICEKQDDYENAEQYLAQAVESWPDDATILNFYGYLLSLMRKDLTRAEGMVRKALRSDPDNGYYLDSLGWIYYQQGEYAKAVIELEKANSRVSDDPVILEHLGDAYAALRRFEEARAAYEKSNRLQGGSDQIQQKLEATEH